MASKKVVTKVAEKGASIQGDVTIIKRKGKAIVSTTHTHNNAVANMLIGIARYLRGDFLNMPKEGNSFIPDYLGVGYTEVAANVNTAFNQTQLASELTDYTNRFDLVKQDISLDVANSQIRLLLSSVIPSGSLPIGKSINELGLFANRARADSGLLARVVYKTASNALATDANDPTNEYHIKVEAGMSYEIRWTIVLTNVA